MTLINEGLGDLEGEKVRWTGWGDSALTWLVLLALGGDGEGMHVQPQVPGHNVQEQHGEGPVRVGVVQQRAQLPALQPVATHVPLGVQEGHWRGLCVDQSQQLIVPIGQGHSHCTPQVTLRVSKPGGLGEELCYQYREACVLESSPSSPAHSNIKSLLFPKYSYVLSAVPLPTIPGVLMVFCTFPG